MEEKNQVNEVDHSLYDFRYEEKESDFYKVQEGPTPEIVEKISKEKNDPQWMHDLRLKSLEIYNKMQVPNWGPSIDGLNMNDIVTYVRPKTEMSAKWSRSSR